MDGKAPAQVDRTIEMAVFETGRDPRQYFVKLIRRRAQQEGVQFSDFENEYLSRSAAGEDEFASKMLDRIKGAGFKEFDSRITGLLWRAYQQDLLLYPDAKEKYEQAIKALANGETYLNLGMFASCIALEMAPEEIERRTPWPTIAVVGAISLWLIYLVIRGLLKSG